ncbi:MAG: hypothetical protein ABFD96_03145, partial [Armatimonadia bacterium]
VREQVFERAQAILSRAAHIAPGNPVYRYALGDICLLMAEDDRAERLYSAAGPLDEYYSDGLRRWRSRAGLMALDDAGLIPTTSTDEEPDFEEDER